MVLTPSQTPPLRIRLFTLDDLLFADSLREVVGWNQTVRDWERLLTLSPGGCFLAEWNGTAAGTATTTSYDEQLAWIGMLLVHPEFRGRGIGRALLTHCLEHLRQRQIGCIKLDATPQGKILYDKLGFAAQWPLTRWQIESLPDPGLGPRQSSGTVERLAPSALKEVLALDRKAFGANRPQLLEKLFHGAQAALAHRSGRQIYGYGFLREGTRAQYLGPIVAITPETGIGLATALLRRAIGQRVYWDIPDNNLPAVQQARDWGFAPQRSLVRMALGPDPDPGDPSCYYGIVDPAVG